MFYFCFLFLLKIFAIIKVFVTQTIIKMHYVKKGCVFVEYNLY